MGIRFGELGPAAEARLGELQPRPVHFDADGDLGEAERGGDLLVRQAVVGSHQQGGAVDLRERLQRDERRPQLVARFRLVGRSGAGVRARLVEQCHRSLVSRAASSLQEEVASDGEQVGAHRREVDPLARGPETHKGLRRQIVGERPVPGEVEEEAVHVPRVLPVDLRELAVQGPTLPPRLAGSRRSARGSRHSKLSGSGGDVTGTA